MDKGFPRIAPFIRKKASTEGCMLDVMLALAPAVAWSVYIFGARALVIVFIAVISAILAQLLGGLVMRRPSQINDMSAVVTGMLIGALMPVTVPLYYPAIAAAFGITFGKTVFGGLAKNIFNPAAVGIAFMLTAFGDKMNRFVQPFTKLSPFTISFTDERLSDLLVGTTPLEALKERTIDSSALAEKVYGFICGNIGEISAVMLMLGFIYLLVRGVVSPHATVAYLASVFFFAALFGYSISFEEPFMLAASHLFSGSTILVGVFMMNDWATTPMTRNGKLFFGAICGAICVAIRLYCAEPDGGVFAVLIMNAFTLALENTTRTPVFGRFYK